MKAAKQSNNHSFFPSCHNALISIEKAQHISFSDLIKTVLRNIRPSELCVRLIILLLLLICLPIAIAAQFFILKNPATLLFSPEHDRSVTRLDTNNKGLQKTDVARKVVEQRARTIVFRKIWDIRLPYAIQGVAWSSSDALIVGLRGFGSGFDLRERNGFLRTSENMSMISVDPSIGLTTNFVVAGVSGGDGSDAMLKFWPIQGGLPSVVTGPFPGKGSFANHASYFSVSGDGGTIVAYIDPRIGRTLAFLKLPGLAARFLPAEKLIGQKEVLSVFSLSSDGTLLALGTASGKLFVVNTRDLSKVKLLYDFSSKVELATITALAFSHDGKSIASAETSFGSGGFPALPISILSVAASSITHLDVAHTDLTTRLSWSADSNILALLNGQQNVGLLDVKTGAYTALSSDHDALAIGFSNFGSSLLVSAGVGLKLFQVTRH